MQFSFNNLSADEVNFIMSLIAKQPFEQVSGLIGKLSNQINEQAVKQPIEEKAQK